MKTVTRVTLAAILALCVIGFVGCPCFELIERGQAVYDDPDCQQFILPG